MSDTLLRPRLYLDTNVFIRAFESSPDEARPIQLLLKTLRRKCRNSSVTSELTLAELLAPPKKKGALELPIKSRIYLNLIVWGKFIDLVPVSREILLETVELRQAANHKLPDAIHVVTAVQSGCSLFMSADRRVKLPEGVQLVLPDRFGLATVKEAFRA